MKEITIQVPDDLKAEWNKDGLLQLVKVKNVENDNRPVTERIKSMKSILEKAKEKGYEAYPVSFYEGTTVDVNEMPRDVFVEGYHQAEKDLELGWEDIKEICVQSVLVEIDLGGLVSDERHYLEVLKRFKDFKERKEKCQ